MIESTSNMSPIRGQEKPPEYSEDVLDAVRQAGNQIHNIRQGAGTPERFLREFAKARKLVADQHPEQLHHFKQEEFDRIDRTIGWIKEEFSDLDREESSKEKQKLKASYEQEPKPSYERKMLQKKEIFYRMWMDAISYEVENNPYSQKSTVYLLTDIVKLDNFTKSICYSIFNTSLHDLARVNSYKIFYQKEHKSWFRKDMLDILDDDKVRSLSPEAVSYIYKSVKQVLEYSLQFLQEKVFQKEEDKRERDSINDHNGALHNQLEKIQSDIEELIYINKKGKFSQQIKFLEVNLQKKEQEIDNYQKKMKSFFAERSVSSEEIKYHLEEMRSVRDDVYKVLKELSPDFEHYSIT